MGEAEVDQPLKSPATETELTGWVGWYWKVWGRSAREREERKRRMKAEG
jgi:hypothetical protein